MLLQYPQPGTIGSLVLLHGFYRWTVNHLGHFRYGELLIDVPYYVPVRILVQVSLSTRNVIPWGLSKYYRASS